jgi:hypothetical protein
MIPRSSGQTATVLGGHPSGPRFVSMVWAMACEIVIRSDASPDRLRQAWYSSRWLTPPRGESGSKPFGEGAWVTTL